MKKSVKIILITLSVILLCVVLYFVCAFFGNPVSYLLASNSADDYIAEKYPDKAFEIEKIGYDFKSSGYYASVVLPGSADTHFSVYFDLLGKPVYDTYENITNGWNTEMRLDSEYRALVNGVEDEIKKEFTTDIFFGEIKTSDSSDDYVGRKPYGIPRDELIVDHNYDINEVAERAGHIILYYDETELTAEKAAEKLLKAKEIFDKNNIKFFAIDFIAQEPKTETNAANRKEFAVREFLYSDIYEKDLPDRLQVAADDLKEYYESEDNKK
ncbi:MAG: DUF3139 domain-containing protein [Clostridia bacterium]|nr:DUF3139 domain-containing protein [Clostridia bacterium]